MNLKRDVANNFLYMPEANYAGAHVILELWGVKETCLSDDLFIENTLKTAALKSNATILHSHFHHFGEGFGITGVIVLAESHISIHTWPEINYAAVDIFMCGKCDPIVAAKHIVKCFECSHVQTTEILRGVVKKTFNK